MKFCQLPTVLVLSVASVCCCPTGYVQESDGNCYSENWSNGPQFLAYEACARSNGVMFDIQNAFENNFVKSMAPGKDTLWLGLTCLTNSVSSCLWDSGRQLKNGDYTNFFGGLPNPDTGACVYMKVSTGQWFSSDCTQTTASSRCLYLADSTIPTCNSALYFRGKCYMGVVEYSKDDATIYCERDCGLPASIHSPGQNKTKKNILVYPPSQMEVTVGWMALRKNQPGPCVELDLQDDEVKKGQWVGSQCTRGVVFNAVCEKALTTVCDKVPTSISPPAQCSATYFTNGSGTIYSPAYPNQSIANSCEYVISTERSASIIFTDLSLDGNSHIWLYNSLNGNQPFAHLTNTSSFPIKIDSTTLTLRIVFNTTGGPGNYFRGEYEDKSHLPMDYRSDFYNEGRITSLNYPNYNSDTLWRTIVLHSNKNRILVNFNVESLFYMDVFDYNGARLMEFNGSQKYSNYTVSSFSKTMWLSFDDYGSKDFPGFEAEFYSIY